MTQPADADAGLKRLLREVALEVGPPVDFLWNQVVKGERDRALTAGAALARRRFSWKPPVKPLQSPSGFPRYSAHHH